jgi:hypothetical protein
MKALFSLEVYGSGGRWSCCMIVVDCGVCYLLGYRLREMSSPARDWWDSDTDEMKWMAGKLIPILKSSPERRCWYFRSGWVEDWLFLVAAIWDSRRRVQHLFFLWQGGKAEERGLLFMYGRGRQAEVDGMGTSEKLLVWIMAPFLQLQCCRHQLFACVTAGQCPRSTILARDMRSGGGGIFPRSTRLPFAAH